MECPHCARPLYWLEERKDIRYDRKARELTESSIELYKCTFCPVEVEIRYRFPTEYFPIAYDKDDMFESSDEELLN